MRSPDFVPYAVIAECHACRRRAGAKMPPEADYSAVFKRLRAYARCSACGGKPEIYPLWPPPPAHSWTPQKEPARIAEVEATYQHLVATADGGRLEFTLPG
jgi:hypothetical protein